MAAQVALRHRLSPPLILGGIFALALFVRSYFVYGLAMEDFLLSGGSDAFYFAWILDNILATGHHLVLDQALDFPLGMINPRPPLYAWSIVLTGLLWGHLIGSVPVGVGQSFLWSTAFWGALTIFPTYYLAKEMFGRRVGYVAAFFLAVLAAHIQRSALSNGDHDAIALFFVVTGFFFFLRSLEDLKERTWVESWLRPRSIVQGIRGLVTENRRAILLAVMAGTALAAVALTWQGYPYAVVILIGYFLVQVLVHKVRNKDPLGILLAFVVTLGTTFLLAYPYYAATDQIRTWFDTPFYLFLAAAALGLLFAFFHRLPWLLVIPPVVLGFGLGSALAAALSPAVAGALGTGFGYFLPDKVFQTIAEAQPPILSQAILSFGPVTSWLAFAAIPLMAYTYVKRPKPDFLFALVWIGAAIFMAMSAVRFLFNASPAFAIAAAWVTVLLAERLGLDAVRRAVAGTGGSKWVALRKELRVRHVAVTLAIVFLLILPNTWYAVDAGSPFEAKQDLQDQVLRVTPEVLRPPAAEQELFYFGAFGFSLPLKTRYFPQAWEWLRQQDANVHPVSARPAFLSWWDYGFEAIADGRHPAVADNFQNGIEAAGHFLLAQSEDEAIAVLSIRLLEGEIRERGTLGPAVREALEAYGLDPAFLEDVLRRPAIYAPLIRAEPERFGRWDDRLSGANARYIFLKTTLTEELDLRDQASLYRHLRQATGDAILYFAVDSRMIPFSGTNTGIFFAPVFLTDHRVRELPDGRILPVDFYRLIAVTPQGNFELGEVPPGVPIQAVQIEYRDMFYNSMAYRIFFGPRGEALGVPEDGLPGLSGESMQAVEPRHGWNLNHFRVVYRTAYFNPFPLDQVADHPEAWTALNYFDALELQARIQAGEMEGTVDLSPGSNLGTGIVFLKYHDGAILQGRVTSEAGLPLEGVRITVLDELDVPHDVALTDAQGRYEVVLPFGEIRVVASTGPLDPATATGATLLGERTFTVTEDQALRLPTDPTGEGRPGYLLSHTFVVPGASLRGQAFLDVAGDGQLGPGDEVLEGLTVRVTPTGAAPLAPVVTGEEGRYEFRDLLPGGYTLSLIRGEATVATTTVTLGRGEAASRNLAVQAATLTGTLTDEFGEPAFGAVAEVVEEATGLRRTALANATGVYQIPGLFPGNHTLEVRTDGAGALPVRLAMEGGTTQTWDLRLEPLGEVRARSLVEFAPTPHVTLLLQRRGEAARVALTTDASARVTAHLPLGVYDIYVLWMAEGRTHAFLGTLTVTGAPQSLDVNLRAAHRVNGTVVGADGEPVPEARVTFEGDALHRVVADRTGSFVTYLPPGTYRVWSVGPQGQHLATVVVDGARTLRLALTEGVPVVGRVFRDLDGNGSWDPGEGLEGVRVRLRAADLELSVFTGPEGSFQVPLLADQAYLSVQEPGYEPVELGPLTAVELAAQATLDLVPKPVAVQGRLVSPEGHAVSGVLVAFESVGAGARDANVTTDGEGRFALPLVPGRYRILVDAALGPEETVRLQGLRDPELRVPVGRSPAPVTVEVVERVGVEGLLEVDEAPYEGALTFRGPETLTLHVVNGTYATHLRPGLYTAYAAREDPSARALLETVDVTAPTNLTDQIPALEQAAVLTGILRVEGRPAEAPLDLVFALNNATVPVQSDAGGGYRVVLVPGTYRVTGAWEGVDRLDGPTRFVRYVLDAEVTVTTSAQVDLTLERGLVTVPLELRVRLSGQLVSASLTLRAANETALDAAATTVTGSHLTLAVAPGVYDVYALRDPGKTVALLQVTVPPEGRTLQVDLMPGVRVSGVASLEDGTKRTADLRFAAKATAVFATGPDGLFEVHLPPDAYRLEAVATRTERTLPVEYRTAEDVGVQDSAVLSLTLRRVDRPAVEVTWDSAQRAGVEAGGSLLYTVRVTNTGNVRDTFELSGSPAGWTFALTPRRVTLNFGTDHVTEVAVRITAPSDARVVHEPLVVTARSPETGAVGQATVAVDVAPFRGLALRLGEDPPAMDPEGLLVVIDLVNEGNDQDLYTLVLLNPETLRAQGWNAQLLFRDMTFENRVAGILVEAGELDAVLLRLEAAADRVTPPQIVLRAFSQEDPSVEAFLETSLPLPSLALPPDEVALEGRGISRGPPEFPFLLYGLLAAAAVGITVLLLRQARRGRRR